MKTSCSLLLLMGLSLLSCAQTPAKKVGGPCEGCEAIYESPVAFHKLPSTVNLPGFKEARIKIEISGIVYQRDGKTPAKDVVLYVYHTNEEGVYPTNGKEKGWDKRHGYIRGWIKTDANGFYRFNTLRPAAYPDAKEPQHIHITIKEPATNEYYLDDYLFADDPLLPAKRNKTPRGGDGVLTLTKDNTTDVWRAKRNIILGLNIPNY